MYSYLNAGYLYSNQAEHYFPLLPYYKMPKHFLYILWFASIWISFSLLFIGRAFHLVLLCPILSLPSQIIFPIFIILSCIVLHCIALHCIAHCIALYFIVMKCIVFYCILYCIALYFVVYCILPCCIALQLTCIASQWSHWVSSYCVVFSYCLIVMVLCKVLILILSSMW